MNRKKVVYVTNERHKQLRILREELDLDDLDHVIKMLLLRYEINKTKTK